MTALPPAGKHSPHLWKQETVDAEAGSWCSKTGLLTQEAGNASSIQELEIEWKDEGRCTPANVKLSCGTAPGMSCS